MRFTSCSSSARSCSRTLLFVYLFPTTVVSAEIEEIIIVAEKRESILQKTPVAVSAITREKIQVQNLEDFAQIQFVAPALVFSEVADMAQISIRGVGVDITTMDAEPGVAFYTDGTYRGGLPSSGALMFDLDRIELLRGPQGTLYGRNSTGGSLNVISRLPGEEAGYEATFLYGAYDRSRAELSGDIPVIPGKFALRGAAAIDRRDGYSNNRLTGEEADAAEANLAKIAAVLMPAPDVEVILRAEYTDTNNGGPPYVKTDDHPVPPLMLSTSNPAGLLGIPGTLCGVPSCVVALGLKLSPPGIGSDNPRELYSDGITAYGRTSHGLSATVDAGLPNDMVLKSITSFFDIEQVGLQSNNDGVDIAYLANNFVQKNREWSQEFLLSGSASKMQWITGVYYYGSEISENFAYSMPALQATYEAAFGLLSIGAPLPQGALAGFGKHLDGSVSGIPFLDFQVEQDLYSLAAYGQTTYSFSDYLRGTAGMRWTTDKKTVIQSVLNNLGLATCKDFELEDSWQRFTGKLGVDVDLFEDSLFFTSVSSGFKAGGLNGFECRNPYDPEVLIAYETGTKFRLLDNTLQLNLTAFYYDYQELQARLFFNNASIVKNATDARTKGLETEWLWLASDKFRLDGSISFLSARFEDFLTSDPMNPHIGINCNAVTGLECLQDVSGNHLLRAPAVKTSLSAEYDVVAADIGKFTLRGEYSYTDEMYHTVFNNDFSRQNAFSLLNARLIWTPDGAAFKGFRVIAFVENINNETYLMSHIPNATTGGTISQFGPPRTWGLQVRYTH